jgi:hypothetical protein
MFVLCECVLDITGPQADADALRRLVTTAESEFDFNAILTMPVELQAAEPSGVATEAWLLKYGDWKRCPRYGPPNFKTRREAIAAARQARSEPTLDELADEVDRRMRKFGHPDRLSWTCRHWGTGSPASRVEWMASTGTEIRGSVHTVFFDTTLCCPMLVIEALSRRFPNLTLRLAFAMPGDGTRGFVTFTAGDISASRGEHFDFEQEWQVFVSHDMNDLAGGIYIGDARPASGGSPALPRSKWANPFEGNGRAPAEAEGLYCRWIDGDPEAAALVPPGRWHRPVRGEICDELRGMLLVCGCDGSHCHGYFLAFIGSVPDDEDDDGELDSEPGARVGPA